MMKRRLVLLLAAVNFSLAALAVTYHSARAEEMPIYSNCCKKDTEGGWHCCKNCCFGFIDDCIMSGQCAV